MALLAMTRSGLVGVICSAPAFPSSKSFSAQSGSTSSRNPVMSWPRSSRATSRSLPSGKR